MNEKHWTLLAMYLSDNATQEQKEELYGWLEIRKEHWNILISAKIIWNELQALATYFDSQEAFQKLDSKL